ncbi:MAG TPA: YdbH domain-containing protein [Candidatus Omnitrophota bacterium]|nr:YdbH domain-containing protein [Candidatus Omnitrophota bacterium]HPN65997.1 YdbH domain-containing protein [Candidatus Omnitrophota bacterium]
MKKEFIIFASIIVVIAVLALIGRSLITDFALKQIKGAFPDHTVTVGNAEIKSIDLISFSNIDIAKGDTNRYRVKELDIRFTPLTPFNRTIPKVSVDGCSIVVSSPKSKLKELIQFPKPKVGAMFIIESLEINDLILEIHTSDFDTTALIRANAAVGRDISYDAVVKLERINLGHLAKMLGAGEKVDISGKMGGEISLSGKDFKIDAIKGEFKSMSPGGTVIIKDEEFIRNLAKQAKQPVEVIRDSFQNYKYTSGALSVSKDKDAILLHLLMEGTQGKRDLTIAFHGF